MDQKKINYPRHIKDELESYQHLNLSSISAPTQTTKAIENISSLCMGSLKTDKAIDAFFKIISYFGHENHAHYRRAFWNHYQNLGHIHQTWMILAPGAQEIAQLNLGLKPSQFARLVKNRRVDDHHAVLLMRLSDLVVAEWSHAGKCRFWSNANTHSPIFFKKIYTREELIDYSNYVQQHYFSAKGLWQKDASQWMKNNIGIPNL